MTTEKREAMIMQEQMQSRLLELKGEYELGDQRLRDLVQQEAAVRETLLRISGAIQVLEELLASGPAEQVTEPESAPAVMTVP
jgi:hypothetical protein